MIDTPLPSLALRFWAGLACFVAGGARGEPARRFPPLDLMPETVS